MSTTEPKAAPVSPENAQPKFPLMPFDAHAYNEAKALFLDWHSVPDERPATVEYIMAMNDAFDSHHTPHFSLNALDTMTQPAASYVYNHDFREFYPSPEFLADVGANIVALIGPTLYGSGYEWHF